MDIEVLVTQAKSGDSRAFADIYNAYVNKIYYFTLQHVGSAQDAEDVVQNIFIEVFKSLPSLTEPGTFKTWLYRIAERQVVGFYRKQGRIPKTLNEDIGGMEDIMEDYEFLPDSIVVTEETKRIVMGLIEALPEAQKTAVLLYYYEEMGVKEIAQIQDCSEGTVKSRLNYARKAMKAKIEDSRKKGMPIVAVVPLPLFTQILHEMAKQSTLTPETAQNILEGASGAVGIAAGSAASGATGAAAVKTALTAMTKVIIGVAAASVMTAGIIIGIIMASPPDIPISDVPPSVAAEMQDNPAQQPSAPPSNAPMPVTESDYAKLYYQYIQDVLIPSGYFIDADMLDLDGDNKPELVTSEQTHDMPPPIEGAANSEVSVYIYTVGDTGSGSKVGRSGGFTQQNEGLEPDRLNRVTFIGHYEGEKCLLDYYEVIDYPEDAEPYSNYAIYLNTYLGGTRLLVTASSLTSDGEALLQSYINTQSTWAAVHFGVPPFPVEKTNGERLKNYF